MRYDVRFTAPVTDGISDIFDESTSRKPVMLQGRGGLGPGLEMLGMCFRACCV